MRLRRWWRVILGGVLVATALVGAGAVFVLPRVLRNVAVSQAAARGIALTTAQVHLGWLAATLDDVHLRLEGVDGVEVTFATVHVVVNRSLHPTEIVGGGGHVHVARAETLPAELEQWRARRPSSTTATGPSVSPTITLAFDDADASMTGDRHGSATAVVVTRTAEALEVVLGGAALTAGPLAVRAGDAHVSFHGAPATFQDAHAASVEVVWAEVPQKELEVPSTVPAAPVLPPALDIPGPKGRKQPHPKEPPVVVPQILPDLHLMRATVEALIAMVAGKIPEGSSVRVDALSARLQKGDEQLTLGSGSLDLSRDPQWIKVRFSTSPTAEGTPLSLEAELPTAAGDIQLSATGGPVPLGLLGMHDGGLLHLLDVEKTSFLGKGRVVLDSAGQTLTFDVDGALRNLSMRDPRLAHDPVRGMDLGFSTRGVVSDKGELRLDDAVASVGAAHVNVHGGFSQTADNAAAAFDFDFPTSSCQALLSSIPTALVPTLSGSRMDGTFSLRGRLAVDSRNLDGIAFDYDVSDRCRLVDVPSELDKARFSKSFTHVVYSKTGERLEETTGPGTANWTELDEISPYMQVAVLTTEDGAFFHHHGFNHSAIRHAVAANIKAHRFVRGASTITMQLAKNLFLIREKTLARKLEELVLADYLEQAFTKEEMMELYLNIIEFGPDIYGVTAAAEHYFARKPNELNFAECMFLSSILPNPIAFHRVYDDGQLSEGWMRTIRARMEVAARTGLVSAPELAEGLTETVVFHRPNAPPPPPRPPVSTPTHPAASATPWEDPN